MNRQNLERKEVRLGMVQFVGIMGVTIGSIAAAFCLGFYIGRSQTFERELLSDLASLPKLPISENGSGEDLGEKIVSEVYAKLNEQTENTPPAELIPEDDENSFPALGTIKEAENTNQEIKETIEGPEEIGEIELEKEPIEAPANIQPKATIPVSTAPVITAKTPEPSLADVKTEMPDESPDTDDILEIKPKEVKTKEPKPLPTSIPEKVKTVKPIETPLKQKEKEEVKTTAIAPTQKPAGGWYAQIAAPKESKDANALASNLKRAGFPAVIEIAEVRGEKYYRVIVGPEKSKVQADVLLKQLKREPYISGDPFLRMVK